MEIVVLILSVIILILSISIFYLLKFSMFIFGSDKELIEFVVDIYIEFGEKLNLYDKNKHDIIVKKLEKFKKMYFNEKKI